jgi:hypothetical protein
MKTIDLFTADKDMFDRMIKTAKSSIWDGTKFTPYFEACRFWSQKYECSMIFMRESGYHSGGWWKNPEYERCYHLSISFPSGVNANKLNKIIDGLFGHSKKMIWIEPPYSNEGKSHGIWHYRLFCDENWKAIVPKGEVYSTDFTPKGWKSFSEVNKV